MKVNEITIEGMHGFDKRTYQFDKLTYLHGKNAAGKSTILQAIQLALLGYIPGTAKNKTAIFRHSNGHSMSVFLVMEDNGETVTVRRSWIGGNSDVKSIVQVTPQNYSIESILGELELPIFNFDDFSTLTANKLKDWFINFLPKNESKNDWDSILEMGILLVNKDPEKFADIKSESINKIHSYNLSGVDELRAANAYFKDMQSFKKSELTRIQSTIDSLVCYDDVDAARTLEEINSDIEATHAKIEAARDYVRITNQNKAIEAKLLESNLTAPSYEYDEKYVELNTLLYSLNSDLGTLGFEMDEINVDISDLTRFIQDKEYTVSRLKSTASGTGSCPVLSVVCEKLIDHAKQAQEEINRIESEIYPSKERLLSLKSQLSETNNKFNNLKNRKADIENQMYSIQKAYWNLDNLKSMLRPLPAVDADFDENYIQNKELLLNNLIEEKSKVMANNKYASMIQNLLSNRLNVEAEIEILKQWVKDTGVNGLQNNVDEPFLKFAEQLDKYIPVLFGANCKSKFNLVSKANSFSFGIERNNQYIPYDLLSSGEKCMYMLSLMICIVAESNSKLKLVMVDDLFDHLDDDNIVSLFKSLYDVENIQMIFAGVKRIDSEVGSQVTKEI